MSKRKLHPVSQVLELIDQLTDDQQAIVLDRLRGKQRSSKSSTASNATQRSPRSRKTTGQPASSEAETAAAGAAAGGDE